MVQPDRPKMAIQYGTKMMIFACWVTKARTQTESHNILYLFLFDCNNGYVNTCKGYIIHTRTMPILFNSRLCSVCVT